jgi:hypothetical protein
MAVVTVSGNPVVGAKYSVTTASSADWASVSNSTYFFDLTDQLVYYKNSSGAVVNPFAGGGLTYFTEAQNTTAPNATVPVDSLTAVTGTTNGDFAIIPKGSGAIVTAIPDSGVVNGNKRGAYAVDLCLYRTGANKVAAGAYSGLFAGQNNFLASGQTNCVIIGGQAGNLYGGTESAMISCSGGELSGSNSVIIGGVSSNNFGANCLVTGTSNGTSGTSNTITGVGNGGGGTANLLSGSSNVTSGTNCFTLGNNNVSSGVRNLLLGQWGNDFGHTARLVVGSFQDTGPYTKGISQLSTLATTFVSTTNTAVELVDRGGTAISLILQDNNAMRIKGSIIGKQTASTNVTSYDFDCVIVRGVGAGTTVLKVNNMNLVWDDIICTVLPTLTANTVSGGLSIKSGGKTTTNIRWVARIDSTESILA